MYENELARAWEAENAEPQETFRSIEEVGSDKRIGSYAVLNTAIFLLGLVVGEIGESADKIPGTRQSDELASMYDTITNLKCELQRIEREIWRTRE